MFKINSKANIFFAIFVILSLVSTLSILVYNNLSILSNNIIVWNNSKLSSTTYEKGDIIIKSIKKYNSNWNWYTDLIWCPQNITMSWTSMSWTNISSSLTYLNWIIYCSWNYNLDKFSIFFNKNFDYFLQSYFKNDIVNIVKIWLDYFWERIFFDSDLTKFSFTPDWILWDNIDDNFNSDNYRIDSQNWINYPNFFQDDDTIPRKTIFGNIKAWEKYNNIYWNNYKTNNIIDLNMNNVDYLNVKAWDTTNAIFNIDLNNIQNNNYDLTIFEFDKEKFENNNAILQINKFIWSNLNANSWYIQNNSWSLFLSNIINWNEFIFDLKNKDYWIFISNNSNWNMIYRLTAETQDWKWIYITPVNDFNEWIIEVFANNIFIDNEKNFSWENIKIIDNK